MYKLTANEQLLTFECPHCECYVQVSRNSTNCCIFRHAVYKHNFSQINPHAPKTLCDNLVETSQVFGCAKPFRIIFNVAGFAVEPCDYI